MRLDPIDKLLIIPISRFIHNSTTSGIVLFASTLIALILANSPLQDAYHRFWEHTFSIGYDEFVVAHSLHDWINEGLMSIFFFVIGLELKREIMVGVLSKPQNAVLPMVAGLGGMAVPSLIYLAFNSSGGASAGWGIPMATDIAFALGILYMLGDRVPVSLKVFLTVLAIVDDLGAVLIIALFYTTEISMINLLFGVGFLSILLIANWLGVRSTVFYGVVGIGGLWFAFLLSGVHATVAGVIAALTIPAKIKILDQRFVVKMKSLTNDFENSTSNNVSLLTHEQLHIVDKIRFYAKTAITPLQRLEYAMAPLVAFVVMPIFALANAGITFSGSLAENLVSNVSLGVMLGLVFGKFIGIVAVSKLLVKVKLAVLPENLQWRHIYGVAMLAGVGFTMSLFITDLALNDLVFVVQAKIGIFAGSIISGVGGYLVLKKV
jgi:Na+:H+ antiporter, NhaA family